MSEFFLPSPVAVRPVLRRVALLAMASLLVACAGGLSGPRTFTLTEAQLSQRVAEQFPLRKRYLELFDLTLNTPEIRLLPEQNRIGTRLAYSLGDLWGGTRRFDGAMSFSYGLRFEPSDASIRLSDVRVESFDVPGVGSALAPQARRLGTLVAEQLLQDVSLHRFKPEELRSAQGLGWQPGALRVVPGGLQLELVPINSR